MDSLSCHRLFKHAALAVSLILGAVGCSNQWRTGDAGVTFDEMKSYLDDAGSASIQSGSGRVSQIMAQAYQPGTTIYFADAGLPMDNVLSVLAFDTLDFLQVGLDWTNVNAARVFYFDAPAAGGRYAGLLIGLVPNQASATQGGFQYYGFSGTGSVDGGTYQATLTGDNGNSLIVRSDDVDGDALSGIIQLRVYEVDSDGNEVYIGKVPSLEGFAQ